MLSFVWGLISPQSSTAQTPLTFGLAFFLWLVALPLPCLWQRQAQAQGVEGMIRLISTLAAASSPTCSNCALVYACLVKTSFIWTVTISCTDRSALGLQRFCVLNPDQFYALVICGTHALFDSPQILANVTGGNCNMHAASNCRQAEKLADLPLDASLVPCQSKLTAYDAIDHQSAWCTSNPLCF